MWQVRVLGIEQVVKNEARVLDLPDIWWPVLGCLLAAPRWHLNRGSLAGRLWPEKDESASRHCLATALWRIRAKLPSDQDLLQCEGDAVSLPLDRNIWVDSIAFERRAEAVLRQPARLGEATERRKLQRALSLYHGPYFAEREQEWVALERERLRTLYLDALFALALAEAEGSNWLAARSAAQKLCAVEPLREDAQRLLMTAHARCGNRAQALSQYRSLVTLLDSELGIAPMTETQRLASSLADAVEVPVRPPPAAASGEPGILLQVRGHLEQSLSLIDSALPF